MWPFVLEDLDEGEVEFVEKDPFGFNEGFVLGDLDDLADYVVFDALALFGWEDLPPMKSMQRRLVDGGEAVKEGDKNGQCKN